MADLPLLASPGPGSLGVEPAVLLWGGAGALVLLGLGAGLWRRSRRRRPPPARPPPRVAGRPAAPAAEESVEESRWRSEAARARERADALSAARTRRAAEAGRAPDPAARERLEAEARALKSAEEDAKRAAYRADKAADQEARSHKAAEEAEARRREAEAVERAAAESAARVREETEARAARIDAEAGRTLAAGLARTRAQGLGARLGAVLGGERTVDGRVLAELEEALFTADIGVRTAARLVAAARELAGSGDLVDSGRLKALIRSEVARIVDLPAPRSLEGGGPPHVVMVVGVNGAGKTTTIGKLAARLTSAGKRVVLAAGDTFRAAATEQLDVWAERAGARLVKGPEGADPGAVVFDAVKQAVASGADVVLADTAGRLHTKAPLIEELQKIRRVLGKALPGAPHEVLLVLDATVGQNAIAQAKQFQEAVGVTSIALAKLDGTAKGGVIIGIADELRVPVSWVGVGERPEDVRPFSPREFVDALFG